MKFKKWKRLALQASMLAVLCVFSAAVYAIDEFMPVADIQPGMTGYAKTVVHGTTIDTFPVEIVGIMKNSGPSGDLILAKFSGPIIEQTGGIAQGMSGSPVYINDKLVGAVAYGWSFSNSKMGMITPINDMLKLWNIPSKEEIRPFNARESSLIPISTPLMVSGFDSASMTWMQGKLPQYKFMPVDTASAATDSEAFPIEPGSSVAASFVNGDFKLGAIGTVTYIDNDHIVAFGHPFLKKGSINYFMHNAYIFTVVNNMISSFKLGSVGAEIGKIEQDRGAGIAGQYGRLAPGIAVTMHVRDNDTGAQNLKRVKIIEDNELTPVLAATSVYNTVNKTIDRNGGGTVGVSYTIRSSHGRDKDIVRHNMYYSEDAVNEKSIDELFNVLDILKHNEFIDYPVLDIDMAVDVTQAKKSARIVEATAAPVIAAPGDTIYFKIKLHPYRGNDETKTMTFTVPKDQPLGKMVLEVRGGGVIPLPYLIEKQRYNLTDEILERLRHYKDFKQLKKEIEKEDANNDIVIEILETGVSMINDGHTKTKKEKIQGKESPADSKDVIKPKKKGILEEADKNDKSSMTTPYIVKGDGQITIKIVTTEQKEDAVAKAHNTLIGGKAVLSDDPEDTDTLTNETIDKEKESDKEADKENGKHKDKLKDKNSDKKALPSKAKDDSGKLDKASLFYHDW